MTRMPGRQTKWAFRDKGMRRLLKKKELRAEDRQWRGADIPDPVCSTYTCVCRESGPEDETEIVCCMQECQFPDCDCEDID